MAVAFRYSPADTAVAAALYAGGYLGLAVGLGQLHGSDAALLALRITYLALAALLGATMSRSLLGASEARLAEVERLRREAQEAVEVRDAFLSIAGHELKTPLTALNLQIELLRRGPDAAGSLRPRVDAVGKQVDRLAALVAELLDVSRILAGRLSLRPEPIDVAEVVRGVAERFADSLARSGSSLSLSAGAPLRGEWDGSRIDQIVSKLLDNAIKYGRGRPIALEVARVGDRARLTVRDSGIGISPADQARIFERFERAVSGAHFGGLGLGLWIVRQVVEAQGGTVAVESSPGEGSTFIIDLPIALPGAPSP